MALSEICWKTHIVILWEFFRVTQQEVMAMFDAKQLCEKITTLYPEIAQLQNNIEGQQF